MSTETSISRQSFYQSSSAGNSAGDLTYVTDDFPPPLPSKPPVQLSDHTHKPKKSIDTLASGFTNNGRVPSPITKSKSPLDFFPTPSASHVQTQSQLRSRPSQRRTPSRDDVSQAGRKAGPAGPPRTPQRSASQPLRIVNNDALSQSPPPAYHLDDSSPAILAEKPPLVSSQSPSPQPQLRKTPSTRQRQVGNEPRISVLSTSTVTPASDPANQSTDQSDASRISADPIGGEDYGKDEEPISLPPLELSISSLSDSPAAPAKKKKRYSLAPPRLSLGQDAFADIGSWGDNLFDSISTTTPNVGGPLGANTGSGMVKKKNAPVPGKTNVERKLDTSFGAGAAGPNSTPAVSAAKEKGKDDNKEQNGTDGLAFPPSSLISPPLSTIKSLPTQRTHQPLQPSLSQSQALIQPQPQSRSTPPSNTVPVISTPSPPALSASTSSSSSTSTSNSSSQSMTRVPHPTVTATVKAVDRFTPSPKPSESARGRSGSNPPDPAGSVLPRTTSTDSISKTQSQPPRERSSSRASVARRPLPPQKPLPTLSLMSPMPLPNPPSHIELKSKISTVNLKTAAQRDKGKGKGVEKVGDVDDVEKEKVVAERDEKATSKEDSEEGRWPTTAKETVELMASINHDNGGLDFGAKRDDQDNSAPDPNEKKISVLLDPCDAGDLRDSHLSADSTKFDPNRLSSTSAGSRGSTQSNHGAGLKLVIGGSDDHNDNRDSNVSTSTITHAMIVSGPVEVLTRARADLVASPATPVPRNGWNSSGSPSPASLVAPSTAELLTEAGPMETTPKQTLPSVSGVDVADDERSRSGVRGRSPSPDSSVNSHSSSSATTVSSPGLSSLSCANRAAGFTRPAIKHHSGWEGEEGARTVVASSSPSPLASPYKSNFDSGSDEEEDDDDDDDIEIGDEEEEEEAVITVINPPPGSRKGSSAGIVNDIAGQRRPSLAIPTISPYSLMAREPLSNAASVSQLLGPLNGVPLSPGSGGCSPAQRYPGWVSSVLSKVGLEALVDEKVDPRDYFEGLAEVAEGESGFVYQAKVVRAVPGSKLTKRAPQPGGVVAIKAVPILPSGSSKLEDLRREVVVMKRVFEDDKSAATSSSFSSASGYPAGMAHVLVMEAMYVDLQEDSLWIRMELMERSLADVVALVEDGHLEKIDEKVVSRFASDVSTIRMLFNSL